MDWSNERWVRIYTRDTADDQVLSWQAHAMWPLLVRKADRAGVIQTSHGAKGIAALIRWPVEVVTQHLPELLEDGRIRECGSPRGYVIPNYIPAQETPSSDASRKREERERRRDRANDSVTERDTDVTIRDEKSRSVTPCHAESRDVTPCLSEPNREEILSGKPDVAAELAEVAVREINQAASTSYQADSAATLKLCRALAKSRHTADEIKLVVASRRGWLDDPKMRQHFNPGTLLALKNFERYLDEARATKPISKPRYGPVDDEPQLDHLTLVGGRT